jgi:DNA processing protein
LPKIGPGRLRALIGPDAPALVLDQLRRRRRRATPELATACVPDSVHELLQRWSAAARSLDGGALLRAHLDHGLHVLAPGDDPWPFAADPEPPVVLFAEGDLALLDPAQPRVAIVGTRRCTAYGVEVAGALGRELAAVGVAVVSGLAAGIDGAAHVGALGALAAGPAAPPIGVAATGLDVPYPRHHRQLHRRVAQTGLLLAEVPLGTPPTRWRFPARNRIIAGLADAVVVVESAATGGSMHTVDDAVRRDVPVLAVPGPISSGASAGTNRLLAEGAAPACDATDVLLAIGHLARRPRPRREELPVAPAGEAAGVLDAAGWEPCTIDQLMLRTGLELGRTAVLVDELERDGWLRTDGGWVERRR